MKGEGTYYSIYSNSIYLLKDEGGRGAYYSIYSNSIYLLKDEGGGELITAFTVVPFIY